MSLRGPGVHFPRSETTQPRARHGTPLRRCVRNDGGGVSPKMTATLIFEKSVQKNVKHVQLFNGT